MHAAVFTLRDALLTAFDAGYQGMYGLFRKAKSGEGVLIVRGDAIGDFVVWLDAARKIRERYTGKHITLVCNRIVAPLAESVPYFDEVIPLDLRRFRNKLSYRYRMIRHLLDRPFEIVLHPAYSRYARFSDVEAFVHTVPASQKIGFISNERPGWRKRVSDKWYTTLIPSEGEKKPELSRHADFIRGIGLTDYVETLPAFEPDRLPAHSIRTPYYVLFPGAGLPIRQWPVEKFTALANQIYDETGLTGIICGGPGDQELGDRLAKAISGPAENWAGKTSLTESVSIIADAAFLVGNETSATHIAVATSTPSVCLLGGGDYNRFVPYPQVADNSRPLPVSVIHKMPCFGCAWNCIYPARPDGAFACVSEIAVSQVVDALREHIWPKLPAFSASASN